MSVNLHKESVLQTEPSFCIYNTDGGCGDEGGNRGNDSRREALETTFTVGESVEADGFSFAEKGMEGEEEEEVFGGLNGIQTLTVQGEVEIVSWPPAVDFTLPDFNGSDDAEDYYKRMVDEFPSHPLFLSNYGRLLQSKGDLDGAEDYYFRATLADPEDGEILLQYAKLTWERHHDQCKSSSYFERAAQAAPNDSHILAAYALFLWEIDDDEEDRLQKHCIQTEEAYHVKEPENVTTKEPSELVSDGVAISFPDHDGSGDVEEYYKRMVDEFPSNSMFLKNYAQVLQSKGDLHRAEDYYFRATEADPEDGEILSQYATLTWELQHDQHRASCYFERSARAAPQDSDILAAYARFLWEIDDDDEDQQNYIQSEEVCLVHEPGNLTSNEQSEHVKGSADLSLPNIDGSSDVEDYYKKMVDEFPSHSLILRNYAHILQSNGDLEGAEEHYSRAMLADPGDGDIISRYAKLVWELHNNRDKASCYFERSIQAAPQDSNVLAAYALFLWEAGEDEEEDAARQDHDRASPPLCEGALTATTKT